MTLDRPTGVGVALLSLCLLATEIVLTRLFSVTIWYHFAFFAISVALFGAGAAALAVHLGQARLAERRTDELLAGAALALGAVICVSTLVILRRPPGGPHLAGFGLGRLLVLYVAAAAPFFAGGFGLSVAMSRYAAAAHRLYFWDLLGAGLGCLLVIPALGQLGAPRALAAAALAAVAAGAAFMLASPSRRRRAVLGAAAVLGGLILALLALGPRLGLLEVRFAKGRRLADLALEFNRWNSFSLVSVWPRQEFRGWGLSPAYVGPPAEQKALVIDMHALTALTRFTGDLEAVRVVSDDLTAFVYQLRPRPREVCVIGAGGGRDVLAALAAGAGHVTAVEINPLIVEDVMRGRFRDYTGGLYERPDVTVAVADGRQFVRRGGAYNVIHLSMVDTSAATAAGAFALTENSLYTTEAFRDFLGHLAPGGLLSVSSVSLPGLAVGERLAALARAALASLGLEAAPRVAVLTTPWLGLRQATLYTVIVGREPLSAAGTQALLEAAHRLRFRVLYAPGSAPGRASSSWTPAILTAPAPALRRRLDGWPLDVSPTTDDRPFFFYQSRLRDLGAALGPAPPLGTAGLAVLARVALVALVMVGLFLLVPFVLGRRALRAGRGAAAWDVAYVACLGLGFMALEVALVQRLALYLGQPTLSLAVTLCALLVSGAAGSRLFGRAPGRGRRLALVLGALLAYVVLVWQAGPAAALLGATGAWPAGGRALVAVALIAPLGLLLGAPLPAGLAAVAARAPGRVAWLWGMNGAASVLGSVAAAVVAIHAGISAAVWTGAALYGVALLLWLRVRRAGLTSR